MRFSVEILLSGDKLIIPSDYLSNLPDTGISVD